MSEESGRRSTSTCAQAQLVGSEWAGDQEQAIRKSNIGSGKRFGIRRRTGCEREHERSKVWTVEKK